MYRFGLQSACAALNSIYNKSEGNYLHYIDDIYIYTQKMKKYVHEKHFNIILQELEQVGLKINLEKCKFHQQKTNYLGYRINDKHYNEF